MPAGDLDLVRIYRVEIALAVALYAALELLWLHIARRRGHDARELFANVFIYAVDTLIRLASWPMRLALFSLAYAYSPLRIAATPASALLCYAGVDLILYAWHRVLHETELGWAMHCVHHTGREFNVSLGVRIHWLQRAIDDVVYVPLAALGFPPLLVLAMVTLNRLSQYWVHTEMIGRLPLLDAFLNTPSNHRVHHETRAGGQRANYGSNFMIWDRIFGTYRAEGAAAVRYGTDQPHPGYNPFAIQFSGLLAYARRRLAR